MTDIRQDAVQEKYGAASRHRVVGREGRQLLRPGACGCGDPITSNLYSRRRDAAACPPTRSLRRSAAATRRR